MNTDRRRNTFDSGQSISHSGRYTVIHKAHALRNSITLLKGHYFPACAICTVPVHFRLIQSLIVESARERFRLLKSQ
jgi:hypothetical protein